MSPWCCRMFDELIGTDGCFVLCYGCFLFFLVVRRPPRSTLFPSRRSSDLPPQRRRRETVIDETRRSFQLDLAGLSIPDRKSTRLNSSHRCISYAVFCLKKKKSPLTPRSPSFRSSGDESSRCPARTITSPSS